MAQQTWQADHRDRLFNRLNDANEHWDVIIAGGGITGAGIAREAARRGLKTLLLERQDFAWGTSSRSSKMVHGGLRYIAAGDVKTTMHSVQERERLMQEAPGLVDQMAYLMAHYKGGFPGPFIFNTLLRIYDFFAGRRYRQFHTPDQLHFISPSINDDNLLGGTQYADAVTDDSRLVIRVLREAQKDGADIINYTSVKKLIKNGDQVTGAEIEDTLSGKTYSVSADVVINATGAWADELRSETTDEKKIRPARGSHLVVAGWRLPVSQSYTIMHPRDKRPVFIFPWEGRTVIGTTDLDHPQLGNKEAAITREEFDYLLEVAQFQFPQVSLEESDIISSWAGVRPLVSSGALNPSKEKRDHSIWDDQGLVSIAGGKLTTFRLIALDVLNVAKKYIRNFSEGEFSAQIFTPHTSTHQRLKALPDYVQKRLTGHFGMDVDALLTLARSGELEMIPGARAVWAELRWAAANEAVVHLDDLLLRRTRLGLLVEQGGLIYEDKIRAICADELGWTEQRWSEEKSRYQNIWNTCYSIPQ